MTAERKAEQRCKCDRATSGEILYHTGVVGGYYVHHGEDWCHPCAIEVHEREHVVPLPTESEPEREQCPQFYCPNQPAWMPAGQNGCPHCGGTATRGFCICETASADEIRDMYTPPAPESEPERETIIGPAIMWPDRSFSWMPTPGSHYAVSEEMKRQTPHPSTRPLKWPQGFVTSEHRFVNRKVARQIAEAAGQIVNPITEGEDLFSEELWTPPPASETPHDDGCGGCDLGICTPSETPPPEVGEPEGDAFDCLACGDTGYVVDAEGEEDNCPNGCPDPERTAEGRPALLYGRTLESAVERLLAVLDEETCHGKPIEHSFAVIGAVDVVKQRLAPAPETPSPEVGEWEAALHDLEGSLPCSDETCICCAEVWPKVQRVLAIAAAKETK